ncbi:flippase [Vibrio sp. CyArs1]|uniref:flippase n=1 Tax=Vibrio sp. CyArs1 TaxID=2682577 RepID=UPI001F06E54C|nr:flippase [Vibrio sp. CyArs1]
MIQKLKLWTKNEIALKAMFALIIKIIGVIGAFFLNIVIARKLGAEQAGYFFLAQAVLLILTVFIRQGLDNTLVRYIAGYQVMNKPDLVAGIYSLSLSRVLPAGVLITVLLWSTSGWVSENIFSKPQLELALKWSSLAVVPIAISQLHGFCFQGQKKIAHAMFFQSAAMSILAILVVWTVQPSDARSAMQYYLFSSVVVCSLSFYFWNRNRIPKLLSLCGEEKHKVLNTARPLFAIVVLAQVTQWAGQLMLGAWSSAEDVALFSVAQRTALLTSFILIAVNAIAAPKFAEAFKQDNLVQVRALSKMSSRLMTLCALPIVGIMMLFAPWLMSLFGEDFTQGANILRILALGQFVNVITGSVGYLLQMTGYEKVLRNNVFISSFIMMSGSAVLIPSYGVIGAAWVTAFSVAFQNLLCVFHVKRTLGFNTLNIFAK